jgi:uncharacterized membrane protein YhaH (DUF805 family)
MQIGLVKKISCFNGVLGHFCNIAMAGFRGCSMKSIFLGFRNILEFDGRTSRSEFWPFAIIVYVGINLIAGYFMLSLSNNYCSSVEAQDPDCINLIPLASNFAKLIVISTNFIVLLLSSAIARRLHDIGKSSKIVLIFFFIQLIQSFLIMINIETILTSPVIGATVIMIQKPIGWLQWALQIYILYLLCQKSEPFGNRYGEVDFFAEVASLKREIGSLDRDLERF